jgi:yecA family protein
VLEGEASQLSPRGTHLHHESWKELFADEEHGGPLVPILALAHEHDPDPEMRPYNGAQKQCAKLIRQVTPKEELAEPNYYPS